LTGPYCSACGQHAHESARSVAALFHDAWHIATHVDGRFWQTLYVMLFKPGKLTKEYFAERRARYLPPVRVYLVLSVLFFAFALVSPHESRTAAVPGTTAILGTPGDSAAGKPKGFLFNVTSCDEVKTSIAWLQKPLQQSCIRNIENHGESVKHAFFANVPKMMFVFVPLMALAMLILYRWPPRYYVEHLVFFLHTHAAIFLILLVQSLLSWIAAWLAWRAFGGWAIAIISSYTVWYVYRAMRVYYEQGRWLTLAKLIVVGFTYMIGFSITLLVTLIVSVLIA
jgi:Protein of unknown function (DUF3667)